MKHLVLGAVFVCVFLSHTYAQNDRIIINEILANATTPESGGEFVELYNSGNIAIDVAGWRLSDDDDTNDTLGDYTGIHDWGRSGTVIPSGGFALCVHTKYDGRYTDFLERECDPDNVLILTCATDTLIGNGFTNTGDTIVLSDHVTFTSTVTYTTDPGDGISLERKSPDSEEWVACTHIHGSTPGRINESALIPHQTYESADKILEVCSSPFFPYADHPKQPRTTRVRYNIREDERVRITVYDIRGNLVRTLENTESPPDCDPDKTGTQNETQWDGRDNDGTIVDTGIYICMLEAVSRASGRTRRKKCTVVVGRMLQ